MKLCIPLDMGLCKITPQIIAHLSTEYLQLMLYQRSTEKVRIPEMDFRGEKVSFIYTPQGVVLNLSPQLIRRWTIAQKSCSRGKARSKSQWEPLQTKAKTGVSSRFSSLFGGLNQLNPPETLSPEAELEPKSGSTAMFSFTLAPRF